MRGASNLFRLSLACLVLLSSAVGAQGPHYKIAEVQDMVDGMLDQFKQYATFQGANKAPLAMDPHADTPTSPNASTLVHKRATTPYCAPYWLEGITHRGKAAFNTNSTYAVFRNVKSYGAKGDGVTDDTAAINRAMKDGGRCAPGVCSSSTTTPAVVYFPQGTYLVSSSIVDYYNTMIIGNPNCLPTLKATPNFSGFGVIDGNQYQSGGALGWGATNVFFAQVRNLIIDLTAIPASSSATGIHWPVSQATSLQNIVFKMSDAAGTQHQGIFIESGSGGFANDLVFYGGLNGAVFGNQQFTMRNLTFYNAVTAINQIWSWGWTYKSLSISNCTTGIAMNGGGRTAQTVGSVTILDSSITNTPVGILTAHDSSSSPATAGSLVLENIAINNVRTIVQGPSTASPVVLAGTTGRTTVATWAQGHSYTPSGPTNSIAAFAGTARPSTLVASSGTAYYERSKPTYGSVTLSKTLSARIMGAAGDGRTDDTAALQSAINYAVKYDALLVVDAGTYKISRTLYFPPGLRLVGEAFPVLMAAGSFWGDVAKPQPVVQVGNVSGQKGAVEWSDMIVSTQGAAPGALLIQWNLAAPAGTPSGMWDVHTRVGGFAGSNLSYADCAATPGVATVKAACVAAYASMHVTKAAAGLYAENVWLWVADHDADDAALRQITVHAGRGLLVESTAGPVWLVGTAVEHHAKYQYQFRGAANVFAGQIQTETAYYQPTPDAGNAVFPVNTTMGDPVFTTATTYNGDNKSGWGLRIVDSSVLVYGAGLYSFFNDYSTSCSNAPGGQCQTRIMSVEGNSYVSLFNLNTVGAKNMISRDGVQVANYADNLNVYPDTVAVYRSR
ncbi:glycoside hydrolase family 55 protein [Diplodia corticola]|uniref:Glycoside hydrolase family 55 protein n=1 Tax=Diplodia corticola TaxID=236234 RepID=A0A1J9R2Q8_9PEZI|nr:glycoside hydrolase family 55 protein [Diplodia corticola]OJD35686.1 glycoside hydrolase family 55 protein [Diplodia corticola]